MKIRTHVTVIFFGIFIIMLSIILGAIYFFSGNYREQDFYRRLKNRATNTAKVLIEVKEVNAELLRRMEQNNPASLPNQFIVIYDYKKEILYSSDRIPPIAIDWALLNRIRLTREVHFREGQHEAVGFLFTHKYKEFTIVAAATDVYGLEALRNLSNVILITFLISTLLVLILGWIFAGRVLKPISRIVTQVAEITELNLNSRLDEGNKRDELSKLSQTFNGMLQRLQSAFISQKNFIANASHEIKTPITVMSAEIEVSLLSKRELRYYEKVLRSVLSRLKALDRLSSRLLMLAQTSADHPEMNFGIIRVDDILWEMKTELAKAFPEYVIDVEFDINLDSDALLIEGDEQLVKVAMLNLMDNGCKYSDFNAVRVKLLSEEPHYITLRFLNSGTGIPADQISRIFEPFYRATGTTGVTGSGIGLSLVQRIVTLHRGTITVTSIPGRITEFVVKLPIGPRG
jgi:signal transduction histidine kinase